MKNRDSISDLISGVVAAVGFLVLTFGLHMTPLLSAPLGVGIYFGVRMLTAQLQSPALTDQEVVNEIYKLRGTVFDPQFQTRIDDICRKAVAIIGYFQDHPSEKEAWGGFFRDSLDSTLKIMRRYSDVARHIDLVDRASLQQFGELLDTVSETLENLLKKLVAEDTAGLEEEARSFKSTIQALNEVNLIQGVGEQK